MSRSSPPSRLPAAQRRRQLLDVAVDVFAAASYTGASMNDVAEAAGVTKPVLYRHFPSKRDLFLEVLADVGARLRGRIAAATMGAAGPREQVELGLAAFFTFVAEEPEAFRLLIRASRWSDDDLAGEARRFEAEMAELVTALIVVPGLERSHRRLLAHGIVGMADAAARVWLLDGMTPPVDELAGRLAELAWAGLRGLHADPLDADTGAGRGPRTS